MVQFTLSRGGEFGDDSIEILRTVTPSLDTVEKLHSFCRRPLLWSERLKAAEVLHSLSPTAETEAAVRAACADVRK